MENCPGFSYKYERKKTWAAKGKSHWSRKTGTREENKKVTGLGQIQETRYPDIQKSVTIFNTERPPNKRILQLRQASAGVHLAKCCLILHRQTWKQFVSVGNFDKAKHQPQKSTVNKMICQKMKAPLSHPPYFAHYSLHTWLTLVTFLLLFFL